jgi:hypothetical protein
MHHLGDVAEMLLDVESVNDLDSARKLLVGDVPDPGSAVAKDDSTLGLIEPPRSALRFL